jgi:hypothetical protein
MKFVVKVQGKDLLLDANQVERLIDVIDGADIYGERHVGANQGSQGYNNAYVPTIVTAPTHTWFEVKTMPDDLIDTIRLSMKLEQKD